MNAVIYYSNTGECERIARYLAQDLGYPLRDLMQLTAFDFENMVIIFPVYSQNIPAVILPLFQKLRAKHVVVLAAYGKMAHGNVLQECQRKFHWPIAAAAYLPTKHSYLPDDAPFSQFSQLDFVREALACPGIISIPQQQKNLFSNFLPGPRARLGIKLIKEKNCTHCGLCSTLCQNKKCLRCLKCVQLCPQGALGFRRSFFMDLYLRKPKRSLLIIYR